MDKWMCWGTMGVSAILFVLFLLDLVMSMTESQFLPFGGLSSFIDVLGILASGIVFYLGFEAYREIR